MGKVADLSVFTPGGQPGAPTPSEGLAVLRQNQTAFMETIGVMPPESLTIADGAISPTTAVCIVDTEGGAPADDLTTINATLSDGSTLHDGMVILLSAKDASRVVTIKNSDAPNGVKTVDGKDVALSTEWSLVLQYVGGVWQQISVSAPLKIATATMLGGVMPQTGPNDGLELQSNGTLRVRPANATQLGGVKTSVAAKAGTVPSANSSGRMDSSWFQEAMDAAKKAQQTADISASLTLKATRSSAGQFTVTDCDRNRLLYLSFEEGTGRAGLVIRCREGTASFDQDIVLGIVSDTTRNYVVPVKITNSTPMFNITEWTSQPGWKLRCYQ